MGNSVGLQHHHSFLRSRNKAISARKSSISPSVMSLTRFRVGGWQSCRRGLRLWCFSFASCLGFKGGPKPPVGLGLVDLLVRVKVLECLPCHFSNGFIVTSLNNSGQFFVAHRGCLCFVHDPKIEQTFHLPNKNGIFFRAKEKGPPTFRATLQPVMNETLSLALEKREAERGYANPCQDDAFPR